MKLTQRERVDGTQITIGRRVLRRAGREKVSRKFVAQYRDQSGRQCCESLRVATVALARRRAIEIQQRLERGEERPLPATLTMVDLIEQYEAHVRLRQLAPKTLWKYSADLAKLSDYCTEAKIERASAFEEDAFLKYRAWLQERRFAAKTIYGALALAKQVLKWGWRKKLLPTYPLADVSLPKAKARPQPCFTTEQVEKIVASAANKLEQDDEALAFALLAFAGLRIGEVEQLQWGDVVLGDDGNPVMLHIRRGGSGGMTKDKDERFVPIHPQIAARLPDLAKEKKPQNVAVCPSIRERSLLKRLKAHCKSLGFPEPEEFKLHSFRHHFASMCANHGVAHRKALAWLGHSNSDMLELYYHLHDEDSQEAMRSLAGTDATSLRAKRPAEGTLRAPDQSKIEKLSQLPEFQAFAGCLANQSERAGFEPAVPLRVHTLSKRARSAALSPLPGSAGESVRIRRRRQHNLSDRPHADKPTDHRRSSRLNAAAASPPVVCSHRACAIVEQRVLASIATPRALEYDDRAVDHESSSAGEKESPQRDSNPCLQDENLIS